MADTVESFAIIVAQAANYLLCFALIWVVAVLDAARKDNRKTDDVHSKELFLAGQGLTTASIPIAIATGVYVVWRGQIDTFVYLGGSIFATLAALGILYGANAFGAWAFAENSTWHQRRMTTGLQAIGVVFFFEVLRRMTPHISAFIGS